jgi:hypothetical protein
MSSTAHRRQRSSCRALASSAPTTLAGAPSLIGAGIT